MTKELVTRLEAENSIGSFRIALICRNKELVLYNAHVDAAIAVHIQNCESCKQFFNKESKKTLFGLLTAVLPKGAIKEVYVNEEDQDGFYTAEVVLADNSKLKAIPSVAVMFALVTNAPIFVDSTLLKPANQARESETSVSPVGM